MRRFFFLSLAFCALSGGLPALEPAAKLSRGEDPEYIREAAMRVDRLVAGWYRSRDFAVPEVTDDATFLRRAFLVAIGRIPTAEEALFFIEIDDADKRRQLVDYLLASPGYGSHMSNWAFDLLRVTDGKTGFGGTFEPYRQWVREAIDANMPWDEFTRELLASGGSGWDPETAAVGYYVRDRGMPLDNLANTTRIFLGSRMECAQCHDDPFGDTERLDFYELAAFTNGQGEGGKGLMRELWNELRDERSERGLDYRVGQILWDRVYGMALSGGGSGRIELPHDYQYRDGQPGELVGGRTPFGKTVRMSERDDADDGREQLADWVTTRTGEQFASVIANRMWERVMGRGVYEPVDEYKPSAETHLPELMNLLVVLMREVDYDLRAFQKILLNTKTFQFVPNPKPSKVAGGDDFHGRQLGRLTAEQIWDSLITLASGDPDGKPRRKADLRVRVGGKPVLEGRTDMVELSREVLELKSEGEVRDYFENLLAEVKEGGASASDAGSSMMMSVQRGKSYGRNAQVRASELPSPAPRDHLLYLFGQSDREVVEGASREPNVGQVLTLMNGFVQEQLVNNRNAHVYKSLEGVDDDQEKVRRLYLAVLGRPPSDEEMGWMVDEIGAAGESGIRNIVAALVMSSEFLFLQ